MASKKNRPQDSIESPEYVDRWAKELIRAAGKRDARSLFEDYKRLAADKRLAKYDRDVAAQRARILGKYM